MQHILHKRFNFTKNEAQYLLYKMLEDLHIYVRTYYLKRAYGCRDITSGCDVPLIAVGVTALRSSPLTTSFFSHLSIRFVQKIILDGFEESNMFVMMFDRVQNYKAHCIAWAFRLGIFASIGVLLCIRLRFKGLIPIWLDYKVQKKIKTHKIR